MMKQDSQEFPIKLLFLFVLHFKTSRCYYSDFFFVLYLLKLSYISGYYCIGIAFLRNKMERNLFHDED